jgi:serpin B
MTRAGAIGTTATQMDAVLHIDDADELYPAANALSSSLDAVSQTVDVGADEPAEVVLNVANSLWGQAGLEFQQAFLDLLAAQFGTGLELVDYRADPEAARAAINAWVAEHTDDRIPELLAAGTVTPDSRLTLVNAISMKAPWSSPFESSITRDAVFNRPDGSTVDVPTMHSTGHMSYVAGDGWQAVELDYAGRAMSMVLVLPDDDLATVEGTIVSAWPASGDFEFPEVRLSVPRWDIETAASLGDTLSAMGMPLAFTDDSDFSGMTTQEPLKIGVVGTRRTSPSTRRAPRPPRRPPSAWRRVPLPARSSRSR